MRLGLARVDAPDPVGPVWLAIDGALLVGLDFGAPEARLTRLLAGRFGPNLRLEPAADRHEASAAVAAYFAGDLRALDTIAIDSGGTPFQRAAWSALRQVPPGETISYGRLAATLGRPTAARAVGLANAQNPINLVVPCHRVTGAGGALIGYGGGLDRKRWLLEFERRVTGAIGSDRGRGPKQAT